jgi:putative addiction module killer protein
VEVRPRELRNYVTENGREPFNDWLESLNSDIRGIIRVRLRRVENGNLGDSHGVGEGVSELVIDVGPGYRVYFGQDGNTVVLLTGGTKKTQTRDIENAKIFWSDYDA